MPDPCNSEVMPLFLPPQMPDPRLYLLGPALPLQGLTVLAVEDSRCSSDAMRLMCQRSGARLRRAETLHAARAHMTVYRPDVVIIDLGLPDGRGEGLISELAQTQPQVPVILGTSGDPAGRGLALAAGAVGFLEKPLAGLSAFQNALLRHLPDRDQVPPDGEPCIAPDPLAMRDDLKRAASLIAAGPCPVEQHYLAGFVSSIARSMRDNDLAQAAQDAGSDADFDHLGQMIGQRITGLSQSALG